MDIQQDDGRWQQGRVESPGVSRCSRDTRLVVCAFQPSHNRSYRTKGMCRKTFLTFQYPREPLVVSRDTRQECWKRTRADIPDRNCKPCCSYGRQPRILCDYLTRLSQRFEVRGEAVEKLGFRSACRSAVPQASYHSGLLPGRVDYSYACGCN